MAEQCVGRGASGVVAAASPLAAGAGASVLRDGGNAYDAVVAMAMVETVVLPSKCGLAGDLVAIVVGPERSDPEALVAVGGAPSALARHADSGDWSDTGPWSVGPPAAPAGYAALAERGTLPRSALAARAIELAETGFPWAAVNHQLTRASLDLLRRWNPGGVVYLPDDEPIGVGALVRLPGLAAALREFVDRGPDLLAGPVGEAIVATVASHGGGLTNSDFAFARAEWCAPAAGIAAGRTVWTTPAPTHGPSLIDAVSDARVGDSPAAVYRRVLDAIARRRTELSDPSGTSMVSAADRGGNVVVVVHSNSYPRYGSGLVVGEFDLVLNNRAGRGFSPEPGHPNFPVAGRRPATTLHAWAMADPAQPTTPRYLGATPGGDNQMPWNAQTVQQLIDGECHVGRLVAAPRWEWLPADDGVRIEAGFAEPAVAELHDAAPRAIDVDRWALRSAQQVVEVPQPDAAITAAADPRTVGSALGV